MITITTYVIKYEFDDKIVHTFNATTLLNASRVGREWMRNNGKLTALHIIERST